jgi:hypothetical protein
MNNPTCLIDNLRSPQKESLAAKISLLAFALGMLLPILLNNTLFKDNAATSLISSRIGAIIFCGLLGLAGFVVMIRGELHQIIVIRGKAAKFYGLIWCVFMWSLAFRYIILLVSDISLLLK